MKTRWILIIPAFVMSVMVAGVAAADGPPRIGTSGKAPRVDLGKRVSLDGAGHRASPSRGSGAVRRQGAGNIRVPGRSPGSVNLPGRNSGNLIPESRYPLGSLLESYLRDEYGYGHGYRDYNPWAGEEARADAYRDAAIANAVVNVIGILATANQPQYPVMATPAPTTVVAPRGHVERQRVLVQEGRTEEYQVWVPEHVIPETGEVVVGHHEVRRREIAPVYEEREIWVPTP